MIPTARYHSDQINILPDTICEFFNEEYNFDISNDSDFEAEIYLYTFIRVIEHVVNTHQKNGTSWIEPFMEKIATYCNANTITSWQERLNLLVKSNEMSQCKFSIDSIKADVTRTLGEFKKLFSEIEDLKNGE